MTQSSRTLDIQAHWERAPGVTSADLAATWCALEIRINDRPVTLIEDARGGGLRRWVHTSAYPLAEWIAANWWTLQQHVRPSAMPVSSWRWSEVRRAPWLRMHNLRAAGDGMPWPDLTLVPEGEVTRVTWTPSRGLAGQPVTFLTGDDVYLASSEVRAALAGFVQQVLDRLDEAGLHDTSLHQEWSALGDLDDGERSFAAAAARLGLDPFDVEDDVSKHIQHAATLFEGPLLDEFLDSADPHRLLAAASWVARAKSKVGQIDSTLEYLTLAVDANEGKPWERGYAFARAYRSHLELKSTAPVNLDQIVGVTQVAGEPAGIQGLVIAESKRVGLGLPEDKMSATATRFAQARALGISVLTSRSTALLDPAHTDLAKQTRAFAAELIAPAEGIKKYLSVFPSITDRAIDAVAARFDASPLLVQYQFENQLA